MIKKKEKTLHTCIEQINREKRRRINVKREGCPFHFKEDNVATTGLHFLRAVLALALQASNDGATFWARESDG